MGSEPAIFFLLLIFGTLVLYIFPFLPAILEWRWKTDAAPPKVHLQDKTIVDYCIRAFKEYVETNFASFIKEYKNSDAVYEGKTKNGKEYIVSDKKGLLQLSSKELAEKKSKKDIIFCQSGALPREIHFTNKIYSADSLDVGSMSEINELIAEKNVLLNAGVNVKTLVYSGDTITVNNNCILNKYTRAQNKIYFVNKADFQYLYAPLIEFGNISVELPNKAIDVISDCIAREIVLEKLDISDNTHITKHFVVKGSLVIHSGCEIKGNIKCYNDMRVEKNTTIIGAIICDSDIIIADNCIIQGPVVSSSTIRIGNNCTIGTHDTMTSLVAENLIISSGCLITGLVLAKANGSYQE